MAVKIDALLEVLLYTTTDKGLLYCSNLCNAKLNFWQWFFSFFQFECDKVGYCIYSKLNSINAKHFPTFIEMPIIAMKKEVIDKTCNYRNIYFRENLSVVKAWGRIAKFCHQICDLLKLCKSILSR